MNTVKICITIPKYEFDIIEKERKEKMLKRSQFIKGIFDSFFKNKQKQSLIDKYIKAYKKHPEPIKESNARTMIGLESFNKEEW